MSDDLMIDARALLEKITPGDWHVDGKDSDIVADDGTHVVCFGHDYDDYGGIMARRSLLGDTERPVGEWDSAAYESEKAANAIFLAASPRLVRRLLAEVERLREAVRR